MGEVSFGKSDTEYFLEIGKGNIPGTSIVNVSGNNPQISTVEEDVWDAGGVLVYPTAGEMWELVSSDANDASGGTGATQVTVSYLDDTYTQRSEVITTNGTTPATFVATDAFRFREATVTGIGSGGENAGNITIRVSGAGATRGQINATENESADGHFTVPLGKTGFLVFYYSEINKNEDIRYRIKRTTGDNGIFRTIATLSLYQDQLVASFPAPADPMEEKTDFKIIGVSSNLLAESNILVQIILVDNDLVNL